MCLSRQKRVKKPNEIRNMYTWDSETWGRHSWYLNCILSNVSRCVQYVYIRSQSFLIFVTSAKHVIAPYCLFVSRITQNINDGFRSNFQGCSMQVWHALTMGIHIYMSVVETLTKIIGFVDYNKLTWKQNGVF